MRALRAKTARVKFWLFTAATTLAGAVYNTIMMLTVGIAHHVHWWTVPLMTAGFSVLGAVFGWAFFLSEGTGLRR